MSFKSKVSNFASFFGINIRSLLSVRYILRFFVDLSKFKILGGEVNSISPIVSDYSEKAGDMTSQYFIQDLHVAQKIFKEAPDKHIDVGSRVDGFVSNIATFMEISVLDIRDLPKSQFENIRFVRRDMMAEVHEESETYPSVSCLHALEHFGLGRYGDYIDPNGHLKGLSAIKNLVAYKGKLYLSVPIGINNATVFNKHRIFNPSEFNVLVEDYYFKLIDFDYIDDRGVLNKSCPLDSIPFDTFYGCGIFTYLKVNKM